MDVESVLQKLTSQLARELENEADVLLVPPTARVFTSILLISPTRKEAAPMTFIADNDGIAATLGDQALFLIDGDTQDELLEKTYSYARRVIDGQLIYHYRRGRFRSATFSDVSPMTTVDAFRFPPYR